MKLTFTAQGSSSLTLGIDETANWPGPVDDTVAFARSYAPPSITVGGQTYTFPFPGFGSSPTSLVGSITAPEGGTGSTKAWGSIVPAPGGLA